MINLYTIIYGDEVEIILQTDLIIEMKNIQDVDHVIHDIMYQVDENGMRYSQHGVI